MFLDKVRKTIKDYGLVCKGDRIVAGVSGGPDSVALLYSLNSLKKELKLSLYIAHLDHMLRKESYKDAEFVKRLGEKLKIQVICGSINIKGLAKKGSLEEIARNARLAFLFRAAKDVNACKIALGHNLDDQAETVLMRILRGAGLYGLSGITPKRNFAGFEIIRPLIEMRRKEIEAFLKRKRIRARIDVSNSENVYFRNKLRNKLLPFLEKEYNPNVKEVLANMAQNVGCDYDYLSKAANRAMEEQGAKPRYSVQELLKLHPAIRRLIIRKAIARVKGDTRSITFQHVKEVEDLILNRPENSIVDLPKGVSAVKKKYLSFYLR